MAGRDNARNLRQPTSSRESYLLLGVLLAVAGALLGYQLCIVLGARMRSETVEVSWNPIVIGVSLVKGEGRWGTEETMVAVGVVAVLACVALVYKLLAGLGQSTKKDKATRVDDVSKHLASKSDIQTMSKKEVTKTSQRLYGEDFAKKNPGIRFGHEVSTGIGLYGGWEDLHLIMAGPRIGKTTASVIPAILDAPGPVVTTSNKSDIVRQTIGVTSARGAGAWIFDPQNIDSENKQNWYYDPLSYIRAEPNSMDTAASALAAMFASPYMKGSDTYFPSSARTLLTGLLLAAALEKFPISKILKWTSAETDLEPVTILSRYPEYEFWAHTLEGIYALTEKTRSGVFGQASNMMSVFNRSEVRKWVEPSGHKTEFDPHAFVRADRPTLYLLSKEGSRSVGILTTILTVAVMEAAEAYGEEQPNGRLPVPMVCPLDEAANTVLWEDLPSVVSHYGSRGIILMIYLQSYSQGINVWGKEKMEALWSATTIKCIGGGIDDEELTKRLSELLGTHEEYQTSTSRGSGDSSVSRSVREKTTMTPAEIAALPKGRWIVRAVGRRPMIGVTEPFYERKWDKEISQQMALN